MVRFVRPGLRGLAVALSVLLMSGLTAVPALAAPDTNAADFTYSQTLTVSNSNSTALTNFQVKVSLTSSNFDFAEAESTGQDLRFYASDGETALELLDRELQLVGPDGHHLGGGAQHPRRRLHHHRDEVGQLDGHERLGRLYYVPVLRRLLGPEHTKRLLQPQRCPKPRWCRTKATKPPPRTP